MTILNLFRVLIIIGVLMGFTPNKGFTSYEQSPYSKEFNTSMKFVGVAEGGYLNDPDTGEEANFGITKKSYPKEDIKNMTWDRAQEIYHKDYWVKSGADKLTWPESIVKLNAAINMGVSKSNRIANKSRDWKDYIKEQRKEYRRIAKGGKNSKNLRGWLRRLDNLETFIQDNMESFQQAP